MTTKTLMAAWACFLLISQFQGIMALAPPLSLGSGAGLEKRYSWRGMWWPWPLPGTSENSDSYFNANVQPYVRSSSSQGETYSTPQPKLAPTYDGPKILTNSSDVHQWLDYHNKFREQYSARPLKWSETLVAASKQLTDTCVWQHTQNNRYGENMSAGQQSIEEVVTGWVTGPDEKDSYTGPNTQPSHFTQVVWQTTTEVGCHKGMCQNVRGANLPQSPVTFWACNYNPPGNVIGEIAQNVKAAPGGRPL